MVAVNLSDVRGRSGILRIAGPAGRRIPQSVAGLAASIALAGCVADGAALAVNANGAAPAADSAAAPVQAAALDEKTSAMVAKARALALADSGESRPAQIDLAALAARSNPGATHRLDGPSASAAPSPRLSPDEVRIRLRELSRAGAADDAGLDRSKEILERLRALSHRPAEEDATAASLAAPAAAAGPTRPVSPEAIMRRMKELSGAAPAAGAPPS